MTAFDSQLSRKTLVIVRHAHRNKAQGREKDNGLSAKGREQAKQAMKFYRLIFGKKHPLIVSSPKLRCIETVDPIAHQTRTAVKILDSLDESSTEAELRERTHAFDEFWRTSPSPLIVACSHGDWIPAYTTLVCGFPIDLDKGGWLQIDLNQGATQLRWVVQDFDFL